MEKGRKGKKRNRIFLGNSNTSACLENQWQIKSGTNTSKYKLCSDK